MTVDLNFTDAHALYDRAQVHIAEFHRVQESKAAWGLKVRKDRDSDDFVYSMYLDRGALRRLEPIAADIANNLIHALDQIASAWVRMIGPGRQHVYYPTTLNEADFERQLSQLTRHVPSGAIEAMRRVREQQCSVLEHVALIKELSNSVKHWKLVTTEFSASAIGLAEIGDQSFVEVPENHFHKNDIFDFYRTKTPPTPNVGYQVLLGLRFGGLRSPLICDPATAFRCTAQFVEAAIKDAEVTARSIERSYLDLPRPSP